MDFITKNIKKIGVFNGLLLLISLIFSIIRLINIDENIFHSLRDISYLLTVVYALSYAYKGYKKKAASFYKIFLTYYAFFSFFVMLTDIVDVINKNSNVGSYVSIIIYIVIFIYSLFLAFSKDLGKNRSLTLAYSILALEICVSIFLLFTKGFTFELISSQVMFMTLACLVALLVTLKYVDKDKRGTY